MDYVLGIDFGTTSVKIVVLDQITSQQLYSSNVKTDADLESEIGEAGYEQNVEKIYEALEKLVLQIPDELQNNIKTIGVTGQMHGLVMWKTPPHSDLDLMKCESSNLYTWQDQRAIPEFLSSLPVPDSHIPLATGFGCVTYFWLLQHQPHRIKHFDWLGTIMDHFVFILCRLEHPATTSQLAASLGFFNTLSNTWNIEILKTNGFPVDRLPRIVKAGTIVGQLVDDWHGIKKGVSVLAGLGDVQCSFLSSLSCQNSALLNLGTSLQLGCIIEPDNFAQSDSTCIQYFPYFNGNYLALAASLNGGNVINQFVQMLVKWMKQFNVGVSENDVWEKLLKEGENVTLDEHLEVKPTLFGERHAPSEFGTILGLTPKNFNLPQLFNSICFGLIKNAQAMMPVEFLKSHNIEKIMGSGSVLSRNPLIRNHIKDLFKDFTFVDGLDCDSATGAALCVIKYCQN
ncbi:hypothetical protein SNE40_002558 [Patella caerulea]|uniref:Carbohydrate kinase FGGY N-terminal domain-containing protein n=1 Tax=Patella caerulea TaxID=87958 RepID=A0AAN8KE10_PATCE